MSVLLEQKISNEELKRILLTYNKFLLSKNININKIHLIKIMDIFIDNFDKGKINFEELSIQEKYSVTIKQDIDCCIDYEEILQEMDNLIKKVQNGDIEDFENI